MEASYTYDFTDRPETLTVTTPGGTESVVTGAGYLPSGPLSSLALGSGVTESRAFDGRYAPDAITLTGSFERSFTYQTDAVGNILEIVEQPLCTPGPVVLEAQTVTTEKIYVSCTSIEAGNGFAVESPGDVTFNAQEAITLTDGFSVGTGASFTAGSGAVPEISRRSFGYQDVQYFLTSASGPWPEDLTWTYDEIGNRLTETRDDGTTPATDTYVYAPNAAAGNTPILDQVELAVSGTRDYTWGAAGHLEEVAAGANVLDFGADDAGRLSGVDRAAAGETAAFSYDGRSYLRRAEQTSGGTASVDSVYDSAGLVHALRRKASSTAAEELVVFVYFAGRPVAQVAIDGSGGETWTYLTTDHLGTPLLATDEVGAPVWEGGFEPFGEDWQAGMGAGALESGIYLRLPGQWEDGSWEEATSGAEVYQNVHRWYQPGVGRYARTDPLGVIDLATFSPWNRVSSFELRHVYSYAEGNPLMGFDPLGLEVKVCSRPVDLPVLGRLGIPHKWVQTDRKEAGLGPAGGGVPGEVPPGCDNSCPYIAKTEVTNHRGESDDPGATCEPVSNVDEACVNQLLEIGQAQGPWAFGINDCWTFADRVINACRTDRPPVRPSPPEFYGPTPFR